MTVIYDALDDAWFVIGNDGSQEAGPFDTEDDAWYWIEDWADYV